ncbi:MAG TPA: EF-hand domain-containing protein [Bryobacteraceae bacterium]|nr:EF-hand domain-containing protein [Bryobacteraceae bacterium]
MTKTGRVVSVCALAVAATVGLAMGQDASKADKDRDKRLAIGETEAKQMLLLMDKDKNGKVSKQEFMSFMEAEFARLDVNKDGELDVKELTQSQVHIHTASHR